MIKYILNHKVIFKKADEGGYFVYIQSLPGCISQGQTYKEAEKNIIEAIELYLEVLSEDQKILASGLEAIKINANHSV